MSYFNFKIHFLKIFVVSFVIVSCTNKDNKNKLKFSNHKLEASFRNDQLFNSYLILNESSTLDEIDSIINYNNFKQTSHYYSESFSIKFGYKTEVVKHSYAKDGDKIQISFTLNKNKNPKSLKYISYYNQITGISLVKYFQGNYHELRSENDRGFHVRKGTIRRKVKNQEEQIKELLNP